MEEYILEFEKPLKEISDKIESLKNKSFNTGIDIGDSVSHLNDKLLIEKKKIYSNLDRWQKVQLARHPNRPYSSDYIKLIVDDWIELHGDRKYSDDLAIISGIGSIGGFNVAIIAHEKGRGTKSKLKHNFGMPRPEGYRKALRIMKLAEKFNLPIISFLDTPGAYPGLGAEERGQGQAIANNLLEMSMLKVPIISIVIGEGASGGALGIGLSDKIICLENTWYSVISPEGCASILWRNSDAVQNAAASLKLTAEDCLKMKIIDEIIVETPGGAHRFPQEQYAQTKKIILENLYELQKYSNETLVNNRNKKFLGVI